MRRSPARMAPWALVLPLASALSPACRAPTQIRVVVLAADRATCDALDVAQVFAGPPGAPDTEPATVAAVGRCTPRPDGRGGTEYFAGSIVVTPSGRRDARILVRAYAGVNASTEACPSSRYASCIVARRLVSFREALPLELPIVLRGECRGQLCPGETCDVGGQCRSAESACTTGGYCSPEVPPSPDGGLAVLDGGIEGGAGDAEADAISADGAVLDCRVVPCPKNFDCVGCTVDEYRCLAQGMNCPN